MYTILFQQAHMTNAGILFSLFFITDEKTGGVYENSAHIDFISVLCYIIRVIYQ